MRRASLTFLPRAVVALAIAVTIGNPLAAESLPSGRLTDTPFPGTRWTLVQIGNDATETGQAPSVKFGPKGASGFDGCTTFMVGGSVDPKDIRLDATRMALAPVACPPRILLPGAFRTALLHAARATVEGDRMTLIAADGRALATFRAAR